MTLYKLKTFFQVKLTIFFFSFCSETVSQLLDENWHYLSKLTSLLQDVSHEREQSITVCDTVFFFSSGDYCWKHPNTRSTPDQLHALQVLPRDTTQSVKLFILSSVTNWASVCLNLFLLQHPLSCDPRCLRELLLTENKENKRGALFWYNEIYTPLYRHLNTSIKSVTSLTRYKSTVSVSEWFRSQHAFKSNVITTVILFSLCFPRTSPPMRLQPERIFFGWLVNMDTLLISC